jgi:aspartate carbamoyltransferase regulatory subunit
LFVSPKVFQIESWCFSGLLTAPSVSENLYDALDYDYVSMIRTQMERLADVMPEHNAREIVLGLQVDEKFLNQFGGEVMHALPEDSSMPMIAPRLWTHPKNIMLMEAAVGIPTRMAILRLTDAGRFEAFPVLRVPPTILRPENILKEETLDEHWARKCSEYQNQEMFLSRVMNGTVIDRLSPGTASVINKINRLFGLREGGSGPVIRAEGLPSHFMEGGTKELMSMRDCWPPDELCALYGIVSPNVRISMMRQSDETDGRRGYRRVEYPLPKAVRGIFRCLNKNCITNCDIEPEATTFFSVVGKKGEMPGLRCAFCQNHYSAIELVEAEFGKLRK